MQTKTSRFNFNSKNLSTLEKEKIYKETLIGLDSVLKNETNLILKMATINCILREALPYFFWTGFYLVEKGELIVGPYQGTLGCLHISFGKGVCGTAAKTKKVQIVADVHKFPGHIACDSKSQSEIVLPVFDKTKKIIAVFDVDSTEKASFDQTDNKYLELLLSKHFSN
ncbi:MAG TPA: GAF domain-containing protein [Patescibacteria group bacterium]|nr:GAF domain-containing protein [Patescibacteria group bacterium]